MDLEQKGCCYVAIVIFTLLISTALTIITIELTDEPGPVIAVSVTGMLIMCCESFFFLFCTSVERVKPKLDEETVEEEE